MNIQIFGTSKCFDTKKAQRYFKERGIRFQMIDLKGHRGLPARDLENVGIRKSAFSQKIHAPGFAPRGSLWYTELQQCKN